MIGRNKKKRLNDESTVFTAELYAILEALILIGNSMENKYIIFSDSKSAIQAIKIYNNNHPIIMEIFAWIIRLSTWQKEGQFC